MKKYFLLGVSLFYVSTLFSQSIPPASIADSVLGWMKIYSFKGAKQPMKVDAKLYSANQLSICDSFANWIQASYTPKGGLGDVKKTVSEKLGLYNQNDAALPQSYGAYAITYLFLKYNSSKKMVPENTLGVSWGIKANAVPGWEINHLSTPAVYYFTMPSFESSSNPEDVKKRYDMSTIPALKPYTTFWIRSIESGGGTNHVLFSKDNRFPFIKLKKGEYLQLLEAAVPRFHEAEKKKIREQNPGNQRTIDYLTKALDERIERFRTGLKSNREKYKNRLEEIALTNAQPSLNDLESGRDVFSGGYLTDTESTSGRMPVYKVDPAMAELCKTDKPQWIVMNWWWSNNQPPEKHMHESIINNFNFEYLYNFFFDAEKVKGLQYKPLRSPDYKERVVIKEASEASKQHSTDKNVFFFEDFSTTELGKKPIGWMSKLAPDGSTSVVKAIEGLEGKWAVMGNSYSLSPTLVKKPFPQNFTLTYDLVASQNFTWGSKGLTFQLSKETTAGNAESYLQLKLRPGFDGRDGEATFETKFNSPPGYLTGTKWYPANGFSNNKKNNRIRVTIKKKEENLQVFIDKNKVLEYDKALPASLLFNAMNFSNGSLGENDRYFISNIKIIKD